MSKMTQLLHQMQGYQGCEDTFPQCWSCNLLQWASMAEALPQRSSNLPPVFLLPSPPPPSYPTKFHVISGLYSKVLKKESGQQYISNELDKGHCMKVHKWEGLQNKCSTFRIIKMPGEFSTSPTKCRLYLTASRSSWLTSRIKLGGTAAKRVKGSVKHAKPAQHCCRHASPGSRSRTDAARGTGQCPRSRGQQEQNWGWSNSLIRSKMEGKWPQGAHVCTLAEADAM